MVMSANRRIAAMLLAAIFTWMLGFNRASAHPFDGDGNGPAKQGSSNIQAYLYIEPYGCRVECLVWLPTALEMFGLPPGNDLMLPEQVKAQILEKARTEAPAWCTVQINGKDSPVELNAATVLRGMPGKSDTLTPGEAVGVMDGMLGLTWECNAPADIQSVEIVWKKYSSSVVGVPVTLVYGPIFENGMVLNEAAPKGTWKNNGTLPPAKPLVAVPPLPQPPQVDVPLASILWIACVGAGAAWAGWLGRRDLRRALLTLVAIVLGAAALWAVPPLRVAVPWQAAVPTDSAQAQTILQALLRNTYRAFEQRDESSVYDTLERSISGDLLQRIYLQTTKSLALEAQDGTRVKITDLAVDVNAVNPIKGGDASTGFVAQGQWTAFGRVGHWGHMHQRINKYKANMTVTPVDGAWKLTGLEVLEEVRDFAKQPGS